MDALMISLKKLQGIVIEVPLTKTEHTHSALVLTLNANLMSLGYCLSQDLFAVLNQLPTEAVEQVGTQLCMKLREFKGAHVQYKPMYPNFPKQVMEASSLELYINALLHYFTQGQWKPVYQANQRRFNFEHVKFREIKAVTVDQFNAVFIGLLESKDSLSAEDKEIVSWFLNQVPLQDLAIPKDIPFSETKCLVAAHYLKQGWAITPFIKTSTDILRIVTQLSGGDVSLAENTKFISLSRPMRKTLVAELERVLNEEDIGRHRNKWVRLFHNLHVGEYSKKVYKLATKVRNGERLQSFYADLEQALVDKNLQLILQLLGTRAGEFGRRLDHVLRIAQDLDYQVQAENHQLFELPLEQMRCHYQQWVVKSFLCRVDAIPTRNLTQLLGHLQTRSAFVEQRLVLPKGQVQEAVMIKQPLEALETELVAELQQGIKASLVKRFATLEPLGKVWIDPALQACPLPSQQRSASTGLFSVARGTQMPLEVGKDTLRFFVYWKGQDIDLSVTFHAEDGSMLEHISYRNLRSDKYQAYHSGDIVNAPKGASEFIDIDIPSTAKQARYVGMNVTVFNGPMFAEHEVCFVGWMAREYPKDNAIYEPATVKQKLDLRQRCRMMIPVVFDLVKRTAIWTDLPITANSYYLGNNVLNSRASIEDKLMAVLHFKNRLSLYDLFTLHAQARGELVATQEEAELVFSMEQGITPFDVNKINAEFLV